MCEFFETFRIFNASLTGSASPENIRMGIFSSTRLQGFGPHVGESVGEQRKISAVSKSPPGASPNDSQIQTFQPDWQKPAGTWPLQQGDMHGEAQH